MVFAVEESAAAALRKLPLESLLLPVLIQLAVILAAARIMGVLFRRIGQPNAVGEIAAGLMLGPSLFGALAPEWSATIFRPDLEGLPTDLSRAFLPKIFAVLSQLGLILLLFLVGLEFDFGHLKSHGRSAGLISGTGIALPFALGFGLAYLMHDAVEPHPEKGVVDPLGFALFLGVAMSITALPILGRMMIEMNFSRTKLGTITITAAAADDAAGWILLAAISTVVASQFQIISVVIMVGLTLGFGLFMMYVLRPILIPILNRSLAANAGELSLNSLAALLVLLLLAAITTNLIGIFAIFGAFFFGAILSDQKELREAIARRLRDLVTAFFLPIFFTYTGLRTEVATVEGTMWLWCAAVIGVAILGKWLGCGLAAYWSGFHPRESAIIGVLMNTRALMELIVINVGYELGVIPKSVFCMLVLMALITTIMTTPILLRLKTGTEIDEPIRHSEFARTT